MSIVELYGALALIYLSVLIGVVTIGALVLTIEQRLTRRRRLDLTPTLPAARGRFRVRRR